MATTKAKILVWDLPVRVGHWLLVGAFAVAWLTSESEEWRLVHVLAGGTMVGVALFRLVWGWLGTRYARFASFVHHPAAAWAYLRSLLQPIPQHWVGHNPAGGWAIVALLTLVLATGASGWLTYQDSFGDWLEEAHEAAANTLLLVVLVHLGGVFIGSLAHGENLVRSMLTGRKHGSADDAIANSRPLALVALAACATAAAWWLSR